jgi:hypothetical protein
VGQACTAARRAHTHAHAVDAHGIGETSVIRNSLRDSRSARVSPLFAGGHRCCACKPFSWLRGIYRQWCWCRRHSEYRRTRQRVCICAKNAPYVGVSCTHEVNTRMRESNTRCARVRICVRTHTRACVYTSTHAHTRTCVCTYMYAYILKRIHLHARAHRLVC